MSRTQSTMVTLGTVAPAFELEDVVTDKEVGRDDIAEDMQGLLVMFICVHCPYVKHVEDELARIGRDYEGKIGIVAISSNDIVEFPQDAPDEMKKQAERLEFRFPYLFDETQEIAKAYGADGRLGQMALALAEQAAAAAARRRPSAPGIRPSAPWGCSPRVLRAGCAPRTSSTRWTAGRIDGLRPRRRVSAVGDPHHR